jgi:O-acetyl-ADP-ribose deacetylase (regulator of RNase III)
MKIEYRKGNMFSTDLLHIAHGCNAQGVMGSGVAKIVKEQYFDAYKFYEEQYNEHGLTLGDVQFVPANGKVIINAITQNLYGKDGKRFVNYEAVAECMRTINRELKQSNQTHVAMPQIGAGLGGGDWTVIAAIIESELTDIQPVVYIL